VIEITSDSRKGASTLATVMPILAPNQKVSDGSKVILQQENGSYQVQKIWLEGQDMGFELTTAAE
jgi:hypothetical protein